MKGKLCKKLRELLADLLKKGFRKDLNELLASRGHELWIMGIDSRRQKLTDICGTIEGETLLAVNKRGFFDTDAGFRVSARKVLPLGGKKVDIFLLNKDHYDKSPKALEPLVVHELAHFLEHTEQTVALTDQDKENARAILESLDERVRRRHTKEWALLLASAARELVKGGRTPHTTIRHTRCTSRVAIRACGVTLF